LWKGFKALDSYQGATFNLRAMFMWSMHDFVAYGLFARCVTNGLVGCPPCGPIMESWSSRKFKKVVYWGSCCYLPRSHLYNKTRPKGSMVEGYVM